MFSVSDRLASYVRDCRKREGGGKELAAAMKPFLVEESYPEGRLYDEKSISNWCTENPKRRHMVPGDALAAMMLATGLDVGAYITGAGSVTVKVTDLAEDMARLREEMQQIQKLRQLDERPTPES